nr:cold shock domain-containing protein [Microcystis panniformis]
MQSGLRSGKLTKWKDERGFGFIQPVDGSQEVLALHNRDMNGGNQNAMP